jgi:hypothetical protein
VPSKDEFVSDLLSAARNVLAAIAFITGIAAKELGRSKLAKRDPAFPVVVVRSTKTPAKPWRASLDRGVKGDR